MHTHAHSHASVARLASPRTNLIPSEVLATGTLKAPHMLSPPPTSLSHF